MPVDKSTERVRQMFGEIAARYDLLNHVLSFGVDVYWRWETVRRVPARGTAPILDVCTGTGDLALAYWRRTGRKVPIVGADFCQPMLDRATIKARRAGAADRVRFVLADAESLPFRDATFQIVCVAFGLRNVADTDRALAEMARVCRPAGRVAVLEFSFPTAEPLRSIYRWYFHRLLPWVGQQLARNRHAAYNYLPASVGEFPQGQALAHRLQQAGLAEVEFRPLSFGIATLYVGRK